MSIEAYKFCPTCQSELQSDEAQYLVCSNAQCRFKYYHNPTPVVAAIVEYGEKQIILAHNVLWPPQWYALITGFLESNEHPDEAVIREVKEELGLEGKVVAFIGHYVFKRMNQIILAYHVKAEGEIVLNEELDDYKIVPFDRVKTWPSSTGYALKDFLESQGYQVEEVPFER